MSEDLTKRYGDNETVDLVMSEEYKEYTPPHEHLGFWMDSIDQREMDKLSLFAEQLKKVGVEVYVTHFIHADEQSRNLVSFSFNSKAFEKATNRGAGRKKDFGMRTRYTPCTVSELKKKLESGTKKSDIIAELKCPKSTFYRILKNLEEREMDFEEIKDYSIWSFTS